MFPQGNKKEETKYTLPEESTIAYALTVVVTDDGTLGEAISAPRRYLGSTSGPDQV